MGFGGGGGKGACQSSQVPASLCFLLSLYLQSFLSALSINQLSIVGWPGVEARPGMTAGSICMMVCALLRDWILAMGTTGLTGTKARVGATKARRIAPFMVKLLCLCCCLDGRGGKAGREG
mgnify:CR=1 FL=1